MPDGIKFSELQSALTLGNNDLAAVSHDNGDSTYTSVKVPMTQLGQKVVNDIDYTQALNTTSKKPIGAINELKNELMNIYPVLTTSPSPIANFNTDLALPLKSCNIEIKPKQASGTPTPSNPLPISGTDTVIVTQTGANLWDEEWELGYIDTVTGQTASDTVHIRSKNYIPVTPSTTFYNKGYMLNILQYRADYSYIGNANTPQGTFTTAADCHYIKFYRTATTYGNDISINYPSTDTQYHAHVAATTKTVSLPETVYGGEVDVIGGSGIINTDVYEFTGSERWIFNDANQYWYFSDASVTRPKTSGESTNTENGIIAKMYDGGSRGLPRIYLSDNPSITSSTDMTTIFTNGQKIAFKTLETTPITLANPIDLTALVGVNNVFGDTDGNTSVEYRESVQKYIDDNIAAVQALIL